MRKQSCLPKTFISKLPGIQCAPLSEEASQQGGLWACCQSSNPLWSPRLRLARDLGGVGHPASRGPAAIVSETQRGFSTSHPPGYQEFRRERAHLPHVWQCPSRDWYNSIAHVYWTLHKLGQKATCIGILVIWHFFQKSNPKHIHIDTDTHTQKYVCSV